MVGLEPTTPGFQNRSSTIEIHLDIFADLNYPSAKLPGEYLSPPSRTKHMRTPHSYEVYHTTRIKQTYEIGICYWEIYNETVFQVTHGTHRTGYGDTWNRTKDLQDKIMRSTTELYPQMRLTSTARTRFPTRVVPPWLSGRG